MKNKIKFAKFERQQTCRGSPESVCGVSGWFCLSHPCPFWKEVCLFQPPLETFPFNSAKGAWTLRSSQFIFAITLLLKYRKNLCRGREGHKNAFRQCKIKLMVVIIIYYWTFTKYRHCSKHFHQRLNLAITVTPQGGYCYYPHLKLKPPSHREGQQLPTATLAHEWQGQPSAEAFWLQEWNS